MMEITRDGKRWIATRDGVSGSGKTRQKAINDLHETEMFLHIISKEK